jgi:hypothetical protein
LHILSTGGEWDLLVSLIFYYLFFAKEMKIIFSFKLNNLKMKNV